MMRLYKKAAVCLLAAAMAISMMTACGPTGGGNSNGGSSTGNNGTSQGGEEKPDDKDDNGANKDDQKDDSDNKTEGKVDLSNVDFSQLPDLSTQSGYKVALENSYAAQAVKIVRGKNCTVNMEVTNLKDGLVSQQKTVKLNGNSYIEATAKIETGEVTTVYLSLDGSFYQLVPQKKIAIKYIGDQAPTVEDNELVGVIDVTGGKLIVDGVPYYTEIAQVSYKNKKGTYVQKETYCFDQQGRLAYIFAESQGQATKVKIIGEISTLADASLFKIPADYKVYTEEFTDTGVIIRDDKGNQVVDF